MFIIRFETSEKAISFFVNDEIEVIEDIPNFKQFLVGPKKHEVFYSLNKKTGMEYSCNAMGKGWSCAMFIGDRSEPYCSHSKAVKLYMNKSNVDIKKGFIIDKIKNNKNKKSIWRKNNMSKEKYLDGTGRINYYGEDYFINENGEVRIVSYIVGYDDILILEKC